MPEEAQNTRREKERDLRMPRRSAFVTIVTTVAHASEARRLARRLLDQRLVACVQITRIESHYWWKGRIERSGEYRLEAKTTARLARAAMAAIAEAHPYDVPEILTFPIGEGHPPYLKWLTRETQRAR